jgi:fumarate hydratase subunit alpha
MRDVDVRTISEVVRQAVQDLNFHTPQPTLVQLQDILQFEPSPAGRQAMRDIVDNRRIASARQIPMCQDTGMAIVFVEVGQDVHFVGGGLREAIDAGVREGYREGHLRKSVVAEPLFERLNTNDNAPAVVHFDVVPGEQVRLIVACKGFGAENMSWARILPPSHGIEGVKNEVVRCVEEAGPNACPPIVVGVGLGGTLELATLLAKRALMREFGSRNADPRYAALERELLDLVNATGIGPQGWGGANTALDVRMEFFPTHIAAIPIAVNLDCHLQRHVEIVM